MVRVRVGVRVGVGARVSVRVVADMDVVPLVNLARLENAHFRVHLMTVRNSGHF